MNNNHPPFRVGQKIVRIGKTVSSRRKLVTVVKGHTYTSAGCYLCQACGAWCVLIEEFPNPFGNDVHNMCLCGHNNPAQAYYSGAASHFAPIDPLYADITKELAGKGTTEETPDVVRVRELN